MGGDGGSIPKRADMVRTKGYSSVQGSSVGSMGYNPNLQRKLTEEHVDPKRQRRLWMTRCWLSSQVLEDPVVVCRGGYLYNKETVVRYLLEKIFSKLPKHLTSIRDVIDVKFKRTSGGIVCPITGKELDDGVAKCVVMWPCGCALSSKALAIDSTSGKCMNCSTLIETQIALYPEDDKERDKQLEKAFDMRHKKQVVVKPVVESNKRKIDDTALPVVPPKQTRVYQELFHSKS